MEKRVITKKQEQNMIDKIMIEYKLLINKRLYEDGIISFEVYDQMLNKLLNALEKINILRKEVPSI